MEMLIKMVWLLLNNNNQDVKAVCSRSNKTCPNSLFKVATLIRCSKSKSMQTQIIQMPITIILMTLLLLPTTET